MFNIPFIQIPFGYVLEFFYEFFNNYGIALILFSLVIKLILLPASAKSKKSMMKTSRLQPKMKQIELACGDDKAKYQQEVQQLYKDEGVSMFGGCIWALLPMLLLFPLYNVIREPLTYLMHFDEATIESIRIAIAALKDSAGQPVADTTNYYWQYYAAQNIESLGIVEGARNLNLSFLGVDLGQTPSWKVWTLSGWSQIGGAFFPIFSGGLNYLSMFISQRMNATVVRNEKGEKDETAAKTAQTGKMMTYLMPLMSVWFGFIMPLGICVYWIAQSVFGIIQDIFLTQHYRKMYDKEDEIKRQRAAALAEEEAEKERIRAAKRAAHPEGITENMSKKKQQLREKLEREAAAKEFEARKRAAMGLAPEEAAEMLGGTPDRPFARGRAFAPDHYAKDKDNKE